MSQRVRLARAAYRHMQRAYPARARAEFQAEMEAVFSQALEAADRRGAWAVLGLCLRELRDWPAAVAGEHRRERRRQMQSSAQPQWPVNASGPRVTFDYSWVSAGLYLILVAAWGWVAFDQVARGILLSLPVVIINYGLAAAIFAGGLLAFARSRTAGQRALALQAGLVLSPGTGTLVSRVFWSLLPDQLHRPGVGATTAVWVYAAYALPWMLVMFAPGLWGLLRRGRAPAGAAPAQAAGLRQGWPLALEWGLATLGGWLFPYWITIAGWTAAAPLAWLLFLFAPGLLQWLVLRRRGVAAAAWVLVSAAGVVVGLYLSASRQVLDLYVGGRDVLDSLLGYSSLGCALGLAQWLVLRRWSPRAHWWILANMLAWPGGWALAGALGAAGSELFAAALQLLATPGLAGLMTGAVLAWLLPARDAG